MREREHALALKETQDEGASLKVELLKMQAEAEVSSAAVVAMRFFWVSRLVPLHSLVGSFCSYINISYTRPRHTTIKIRQRARSLLESVQQREAEGQRGAEELR